MILFVKHRETEAKRVRIKPKTLSKNRRDLSTTVYQKRG